MMNAFDAVGNNWLKSLDQNPLVIVWGIRHSKRGEIAALLQEYRCAFSFGNTSWARQKAYINHHRPILVFVEKGEALPKHIENYLNSLQIPVSPLPVLSAQEQNQQPKSREKKAAAAKSIFYCGNNWTAQFKAMTPIAFFFDVPDFCQQLIANYYKNYSCLFANAISEKLVELMSSNTGSVCFFWDTLDNENCNHIKQKNTEEYLNLCKINYMHIDVLPYDLILELTTDKLNQKHNDDLENKPLAIIIGPMPINFDVISPLLSDYNTRKIKVNIDVYKLTPLLIASPTFIITPKAHEKDISYLLNNDASIRYLSPHPMSFLWQRQQNAHPTFSCLSQIRPNACSLPESAISNQLDYADITANEQSLARALSLRNQIRQLWEAQRERAKREMVTTKTIPYSSSGVLAIWHVEEENWTDQAEFPITGHSLVSHAIQEAGDRPVYCLQLKNGEAVFPTKTERESFSANCYFIRCHKDMDEIMYMVDTVFVIGAFQGFEALLYGKRVITMGAPFYAGWGITEDVCPVARFRELSLAHLVSAVFLNNFPYVSPYSSEPIEAEQALAIHYLAKRPDFSYIFKWLYGNIGVDSGDPFIDIRYKFHTDNAVTEEWIRNILPDTVMGRILSDLTGNVSPANSIIPFLETCSFDISLHLYSLLNVYCKINIMYDAIKDISLQYKEWFKINGEYMSERQQHLYYTHYYQALSYNRFRDFGPPPPLFIEKYINSKEKQNIISVYFKILSATCSYELIENVLNNTVFLDLKMYYRAALLLNAPPKMRERNSLRRQQIMLRLCNEFLKYTPIGFFSHHEELINNLLRSHLKGDTASYEESLGQLEYYVRKGKPSKLPKRFSLLLSGLNWLLEQKHYLLAHRVYLLIAPLLNAATTVEKEVQFLTKDASQTNWLGVLNKIRVNMDTVPAAKQLGTRYLAILGRFKEARALLTTARSPRDSIERVYALSRQYHILQFYETTSDICWSAPQVHNPRGYVFILSAGVYQSVLYPVVVYELAKRGYASVVISSDIFTTPPTSSPQINRLRSILSPSPYGEGEVKLQWTLDYENKEISAQGINFFYGIYEYLTVMLRTTQIDWNAPDVQKWTSKAILMADAHLRACEAAHTALRAIKSKGVVLLNTPYAAPQSVWLNYIDHHNDPSFRGIFFRSGHPTTLGHDVTNRSTTISVLDLMAYPNCRLPFLARPDEFETWYQENGDSPYLHDIISATTTRMSACHTPSGQMYEHILRAKQAGKKVICCYSRLLFDRALRVEGGPGHSDMEDWILHTIEVARSCPDLLLLLKPHPHENIPSLAADALITLRDIIPGELPKNVIYLESEEFTTPQLNGLIDLAVLWLGTAAMELTILGIPVIITSYSGQQEIPLNLIYPQSRSQYTACLRSLNYPPPTDNDKKRAAALLHYLQSDEVMKPFRHAFTSADNDFNCIPYYDFEQIAQYLINGDPDIGVVVDQIIAGVEKAPTCGGRKAIS